MKHFLWNSKLIPEQHQHCSMLQQAKIYLRYEKVNTAYIMTAHSYPYVQSTQLKTSITNQVASRRWQTGNTLDCCRFRTRGKQRAQTLDARITTPVWDFTMLAYLHVLCLFRLCWVLHFCEGLERFVFVTIIHFSTGLISERPSLIILCQIYVPKTIIINFAAQKCCCVTSS